MSIQAQLYPSNAEFPLCDNGYSTGSSFVFIQPCFNTQQKHQQQQQQLEQPLRQLYNERKRSIDPSFSVSDSKTNSDINKYNNNPLSSNSPTFAFPFQKQFENHREEIDHYITLQNENLRFMLQEHKKQQVAALLKKMESDSLYILKKKEEEIAQANEKRVELEDFLRRLEAENQAWRKVAEENESMVLSLHKNLEEMRERAYYWSNNGVVADDVESCCDESRGNGEIEGGIDENGVVGCDGVGHLEQITRKMMVCKRCSSRSSCFLFLPCRHLCSCKACEPFLQACPVCRMPKKASIEILIF